MYGVTNVEIGQLVAAIDYSNALTIVATEDDVREACTVAKHYGLRAVVAFPQHIGLIADELKGSRVLAQIPVGFPCGGHTTKTKCIEAEQGLERGATDLDMVMNIAAFKAGDYATVSQDIGEVLRAAKPYGVPFKVIIEIGALTDDEKVTAAKLVADAGADFVKTCTGWDGNRATVHDILLIREAIGNRIKIKASGGVSSIEDGIAFMRAGANVVAMRRTLIDQLERIGYRAP